MAHEQRGVTPMVTDPDHRIVEHALSPCGKGGHPGRVFSALGGHPR